MHIYIYIYTHACVYCFSVIDINVIIIISSSSIIIIIIINIVIIRMRISMNVVIISIDISLYMYIYIYILYYTYTHETFVCLLLLSNYASQGIQAGAEEEVGAAYCYVQEVRTYVSVVEVAGSIRKYSLQLISDPIRVASLRNLWMDARDWQQVWECV